MSNFSSKGSVVCALKPRKSDYSRIRKMFKCSIKIRVSMIQFGQNIHLFLVCNFLEEILNRIEENAAKHHTR